MSEISRLEPVGLRELWNHEARGFSTWLVRNLDILGDALGLELSNPEPEKAVGRFSLDLLAETADGVQVIIENQLEVTDHDHLGKVLTYLSNLEAKVAVWIAGEVRDEHTQAVRWLNEFTPADMSFYLVRLSAFRIDGSKPAPHFAIVAGPSETGRRVGQEKKEFAERHVLRLRFWEGLLARARDRGFRWHQQISPGKEMWLGAGAGVRAGVALNYLIWKDEAGAELYINTPDPDENKRLFDRLIVERDSIEQDFGERLIWDRMDEKKASRVRYLIQQGGLDDGEESWPAIQEAMVSSMDRLARAVLPRLGRIDI